MHDMHCMGSSLYSKKQRHKQRALGIQHKQQQEFQHLSTGYPWLTCSPKPWLAMTPERWQVEQIQSSTNIWLMFSSISYSHNLIVVWLCLICRSLLVQNHHSPGPPTFSHSLSFTWHKFFSRSNDLQLQSGLFGLVGAVPCCSHFPLSDLLQTEQSFLFFCRLWGKLSRTWRTSWQGKILDASPFTINSLYPTYLTNSIVFHCSLKFFPESHPIYSLFIQGILLLF